jgi:prepilin-type N-terminal cleavage/methylation domain-containing protein
MKGFSLLEVIIAIAVISSGVVGAVALINRTISASLAVRHQLIAANLAQEGMEVVHNIRHTNWIRNVAWDDGLIEGDSCVNFDSAALINPCDGGSRRLFIFNNHYVHNPSGTATSFWRFVNITSGLDGATPYKLIRSVVSWDSSTISAEERLYNWK